MSLPKRKTDIKIYNEDKHSRPEDIIGNRQSLLDRITKNDVFLPDAILHDDLDAGMLDYVKKNFIVVSDGQQIPIVNKILTIQRWAEFSNNWEFSDGDDNISLPFIVLVRKPNPRPGTHPTFYTIPERRNFYYQTIKKVDYDRVGADVYKIPQPIAIDIDFEVTIVCNRFRDLNKLNKTVLQKFTSRQSYTTIKGHYIPILLESVDDTSPISSIENRRFYIQTYKLTMLGLLVDPEEFEVKPAISRALLMNDFITTPKVKRTSLIKSIELTSVTFTANGSDNTYSVSETISELFYVTINGLLQELNIDYYFIPNTSRITFVATPPSGSLITVVYYKGKNVTFLNTENVKVALKKEYFIFTGDTSFTLTYNIDSVVIFDINGLVQEEYDGYTYVTGTNVVSLIGEPPLNSAIGVTYFYKV